MNKKILLVEPAYRTKYPPLGLMKLATYHKQKGDEVTLVRGKSPSVRDNFWDKVYITTLFTYTWKETTETIRFYKDTLFQLSGKLFVGGILANLLEKELYNETGVQPVTGLLDSSSKLGEDDNVNIDLLPPDYEILKQVENENFHYDFTDAYLGYATRGCVRNCEFCAVKRLEKEYQPYIDIKKMIDGIRAASGEKRNLQLMDNNILASKHFSRIIADIKAAGFYKGATYAKTKQLRFVDFNQGLDGRLLTEEKMKLLAEIPLSPMRIAFDSIQDRPHYEKAVRLAHEYGQRSMSNYILYNFKNDTPEDFYERLRINIKLNEEFKKDKVRTAIYSFPMRYIPLDAKERDVHTGNKAWNKRYLRGIKLITNVTMGSVMPGAEFFNQAFGENAEEFKEILLMPDEFIRNRVVKNWKKLKGDKKLKPYVKEWRKTYRALTPSEKERIIEILAPNDFEAVKKECGNGITGKTKKLLIAHLNAEEEVKAYADK